MSAKPEPFDAIILGAGGAGLMCAAIAGQRGKRVLVIDHADEPGKKILISGGGRCNFTNVHTAADRYLSANPHFAKSALARYTPADFLALVETYGIAWHEKTLGQLFCDGSARQIVAMLLDECSRGDVEVALGAPASDIDHGDGQYRVGFGGRQAVAPALVIATGGPSIPKMGATDFAYGLARRFGLSVVEPRPALVPLTLGPGEQLFRDLSGVAAPVVARCGKTRFAEAALFTHRGLSGPAILQISSYWRHGEAIGIDFLPDQPRGWLVAAKRQRPRASLRGVPRPLGAGAGAATAAGRRTRRADRCAVDRGRGAICRLAVRADRHRRFRQGRSHHWRHRHRRAVITDDDGEQGAGALRDRRGGRCHRLARRLQLPMGLGQRRGGRSSDRRRERLSHRLRPRPWRCDCQ